MPTPTVNPGPEVVVLDEDALVLAWAGPAPALGETESGAPVELPAPVGRRDGSGVALRRPLGHVGG